LLPLDYFSIVDVLHYPLECLHLTFVLLPLLLKCLPSLQQLCFRLLQALDHLLKLRVLLPRLSIEKSILIQEPLVLKFEQGDQLLHLLFLGEAGSRLIQGLMHVRGKVRGLQVDLVGVRVPLEWLGVARERVCWDRGLLWGLLA
jgi:hypothetical protein